MLDRGVLSRLFVLTEQEAFTLTMYVDIDQNRQANRNQGYIVQAEALLKDLIARHGSEPLLEEAAARAQELIRSVEPHGKTALVVVHPERQLAEVHTILLRFPSSAHWRRGAFLRPIVEAMDEHERFGVLLTSRQRARIFTVQLGEITEHSDLLSDTGQKVRGIGTDQWRSDKRQERRHEEQVMLHVKRAMDALHDLALKAPFDRLIVAGPLETANQVAKLLPKRMHGKLVETLSMSVTATLDDVLQRTIEVQQRLEREQEQAQVEGLLAELHQGGKAISGIDQVVAATNQGRIWKLFYIRGFTIGGSECRGCHLFHTNGAAACPLCSAPLHRLPQLVDRLSQEVLDSGGQIEVIAGDAAKRLSSVDQIAAFLRY